MDSQWLVPELVQQALRAVAYYFGVLLLARIAGKRLAGQMTTFDLIVLITLATATQRVAVDDGTSSAMVFVVVVLLTHRGVALLGARYPALRHLLRGKPRALVVDGVLIPAALRDEAVSQEELLAGLRKLGFERIEDVRLAVLEETGHISAVGR
jgi:uncharacterized membrane protein YcaP (DUF421 family)